MSSAGFIGYNAHYSLSHKYVMHIHREMGQEKANVMARYAQTLGFVFFGFSFFFFFQILV